MARSHSIYIVLINGEVDSAFTVKHELRSSLPLVKPDGLRIIKVRDGEQYEKVAALDLTDEIYEK